MDESAIDTLVHTAGTLIMMQLAGYVAKSSGKILPKGEYGLGAFLSTIALPALLFRATATLDFGVQRLPRCHEALLPAAREGPARAA